MQGVSREVGDGTGGSIVSMQGPLQARLDRAIPYVGAIVFPPLALGIWLIRKADAAYDEGYKNLAMGCFGAGLALAFMGPIVYGLGLVAMLEAVTS